MEKEYTFIVVEILEGEYILKNPKSLMGMNKDKALGSIKWWRKITCRKNYPCFIYDPSKFSLFNKKSGKVNKMVVDMLVHKYNGKISSI
jgi:hypothetical protein